MSVFGNSYPQFIYFHGVTGEVVVPLPYAIVTRSDPETEVVEFTSEIDGQRVVMDRGTHWVVEMKYLLFKETDARTKYEVFQYYKNLPVSLFIHADGYPFYRSSNHLLDALFVLTEVEPFLLTTTDYKDGLNLTFRSLNPVWVGQP